MCPECGREVLAAKGETLSRLEPVEVDAQPVQEPRVPAPARFAQRPWLLDRLIAVLAVPIHFYAPSVNVYGHIKAYKGA